MKTFLMAYHVPTGNMEYYELESRQQAELYRKYLDHLTPVDPDTRHHTEIHVFEAKDLDHVRRSCPRLFVTGRYRQLSLKEES